MKTLLLPLSALLLTFAFCGSNDDPEPEVVKPPVVTPEPSDDDHIKRGYALNSSMQGTAALVDKDHKAINIHMLPLGWNYTESPNISENDHNTAPHSQTVYDAVLGQYVFKLTLHVEEVVDGDRGTLVDRQRNEVKSQADKRQWDKMNGNWDEWQVLDWKFKIPKGFQPSSSFTHIHQLKAFEGNNGLPLITMTLRANSNGKNRRVQVIYTGDTGNDSKRTLVDNIALEQFEDEWVQVTQEAHFADKGFYRIKAVRLSDKKILIDHIEENISMWHSGAISIRNKFGIYRSFGKPLSETGGVVTNGIKDEDIYLADFKVYEKNTNSAPVPHYLD